MPASDSDSSFNLNLGHPGRDQPECHFELELTESSQVGLTTISSTVTVTAARLTRSLSASLSALVLGLDSAYSVYRSPLRPWRWRHRRDRGAGTVTVTAAAAADRHQLEYFSTGKPQAPAAMQRRHPPVPTSKGLALFSPAAPLGHRDGLLQRPALDLPAPGAGGEGGRGSYLPKFKFRIPSPSNRASPLADGGSSSSAQLPV